MLTGPHKTNRLYQELHSENKINKITQFQLILSHSIRKNALSHVEIFSIFYFKSVFSAEMSIREYRNYAGKKQKKKREPFESTEEKVMCMFVSNM